MNTKDSKVNEELIKSGQGKRLIQFRIEKGFNSRLSFANELKISVTTINDIENNLRKISKNLIALITEKWKDTNENWLIYGSLPKLLTNTPRFQLPGKAEEPEVNYISTCRECAIKDKEISALKDEIIRLLKEASGLKNASSG